MPPQARHRARSSIDNLFDLVENLEEDQLQNLLDELNSTPHEANIDVSAGVAYFEEQRRRDASLAAGHKLRPTPSFINTHPAEPTDWPRQKPRPVSGSHWRGSMRIVSAPYSRTNTEPISPPLTASPPASPPVRRRVTAPMAAGNGRSETTVNVTRAGGGAPSPVSPPRHSLDHDEESHARPSLSEFGAFSFGGDGAADARHTGYASDEEQQSTTSSGHSSNNSRPVSPTQAAQVQVTPAPPQQQTFARISTMPSLPTGPAPHMRPRTATGHAAASATANPRAFRRISRPQFLAPLLGAAPPADELASKLMSAFLFGGDTPSSAPPPAFGQKRAEGRRGEWEEMLKEPASPRSRAVFGHVEREAPAVSGIFEVLTEG